jgi:hypothetical protein
MKVMLVTPMVIHQFSIDVLCFNSASDAQRWHRPAINRFSEKSNFSRSIKDHDFVVIKSSKKNSCEGFEKLLERKDTKLIFVFII